MKLVDNAREVWHHYSTMCLAFVALAQTAWLTYPADWKLLLPVWAAPLVAKIVAVVAGLGVVGKFVKQDLPSDHADKPKDVAP